MQYNKAVSPVDLDIHENRLGLDIGASGRHAGLGKTIQTIALLAYLACEK